MAAIRMVAPQFNIPPDKIQLVEQYILALRQYLPQAAQEHLHMVVQRFVQQKSQLDMAKWAQAVDLTSHRAGLIISNDLSLAARFIGQEPITVGGMQPEGQGERAAYVRDFAGLLRAAQPARHRHRPMPAFLPDFVFSPSSTTYMLAIVLWGGGELRFARRFSWDAVLIPVRGFVLTLRAAAGWLEPLLPGRRP